MQGAGLADGENTERMWSKLGKFSKITKEMTPENRIDFLSQVLLYEGQKIRMGLGNNFCSPEIIESSGRYPNWFIDHVSAYHTYLNFHEPYHWNWNFGL